MKPFLKWVGGKAKLVEQVRSVSPPSFTRYVEPFVGGGAVFIDIIAEDSAFRGPVLLADMNPDLILAWQMVQAMPAEFLDHLRELEGPSTLSRYMRTRKEFNNRNTSPAKRAADFIYLNKACFQGLWRVNKKGHFNVPFNQKENINLERGNIVNVGEAMRFFNTAIWNAPFHVSMSVAVMGDFVYLDPPYYKTFSNYTSDGFTLDHHKQLVETARACVQRGAHVVCSQGDNMEIVDLWAAAGFAVWEVTRQSNVSANASSRKRVYEYIMSSFKDGTPAPGLVRQV